MLGGMRAINVSLTRSSTSPGDEESRAWATALSALARNYGDVFRDHAASAVDGEEGCHWSLVSRVSRSARVNFHSKGWAICS